MITMASWKLKGVVPDSDDEDSLDSQGNPSDGDGTADQRDGSPRNAPLVHNNIARKEYEISVGHESVDKPVVQDNSSAKLWEDVDWEAAGLSKPNTNDRLMLASSSPDLPQVFRAPMSLWDLGRDLTDSESESTGNLPDLPVSNPLPAADEISKTYVRLTSPVSSLLSSLTDSQQNETSISQSKTSLDAESYSPRIPLPASNDDSPIEYTTAHAMQGPANLYRRALRERAPIQLHPYAMEQEKYRQSLKARGIAPMRIAETQDEDHRRNHIPSSDPISQDFESQDVEQETEESQQMDYNWDLDPVSMEKNIESQVPRSQRSDNSASNDGDEFPDINELFRGRSQSTRRMEPKRRMNTYSSKAKRPQLSQIHTQRARPTDSITKMTDIFDVPASPPATSSPFATTVGRTVSQAPSISSKEPTPGWLDQDELSLQPAPDLPTPATSAMKPVSDQMFLESDLDDDPFANELTELASSSSDESVQIRKVSKKIRGVLPASHLRLDQQLKQLKHPVPIQRDSVPASPEKSLIRRGVALPKAPGATQLAPSSMSNGLPFLSDESDEDESDHNGLIMEDDNAGDLNSAFSQSRVGYAEEEDRIDAMLPSLKRQRNFKSSSNKKMRVGSASLTRGPSHQPKITQHIVKGTSSKSHTTHRARNGKQSQGASIRNRRPKPPRLSILDVANLTSGSDGKVPQFIKVAARTARSKPGQGRHSPSKKFIRLANREDTLDAQSVLEEWKGGRIIPKIVETSMANSGIASRSPLSRISGNHQTRFQPPMAKAKPRSQALQTGYGRLDMPRQLVVSRGRQMSIKDYASAKQPPLPQPHSIPDPAQRAALRLTQRRSTKPRSGARQSRPAQLETSEIAYSGQNPAAAFKNTKKALDSLFRLNRKRPVKQQNVQLHRFLTDDDTFLPSVEAASSPEPGVPGPERFSSALTTTLPKPRKRLPQRVDAGAARYRQPSEPLVLDFLHLANIQNVTGQDNKLMGLGKYGTRYPIHFDIMPLQPGTFFHESTFIGSGCLSEVIKVPGAISFGASRGYRSFRLGDKDFRWGQWNEDVSSEVGLFFDCLVELLIQYPPSPNSSDPTPAASVEFMVDYLQHHICFGSSEARSGFLSRMLEALHDFSCRVSEAGYQSEEKQNQRWIDTMARCTVLILQLLHLSRAAEAVTTVQLEDLLKRVACLCAKLLIHQGLDSLRKLYDDLQYLSFRERGIQDDQYIALSWVTIMKVLGAARIPRGSFWEIANMALAEGDKKVVDARLMEKKWYSVYSLLPLCEFNEFGVVIPGLRHRISFDNWAIPQDMLKNMFVLYSTNSKQSPGFNDYCRALVSRCHYLAREWGWWRCNGMIGTIFDFFASQKLGHLRNEEVYKSPRFLEELDTEPSLDVEPEDRCFHIFLKIVALAIKHLRETGDERGIRNLVARLLPNHDRQYPKEEAIHQRDLAALRNHHDLLCTLYWASPQDCRPSLSLVQELIVADYSHKEACLINLRALDNLARYVFTSPADESAVYQQFTRWELAFSDKLLHQYLDTSSDFRKQAELLADSCKHPITEVEMQKAMDSYRDATRVMIDTLLSNLSGRIRNAKNAEANLSCLNAELLSKILNPGIYQGIQSAEQRMFSHAIDALQSYMIRADQLHPFTNPQPIPFHAGADSQGSFDVANVDFERQMMIYPMHEIILPNFATITKDVLECRLHQFEEPGFMEEPNFMESLVRCWAYMVSLVTEEKCDLRDFVVEGPYSVFENRRRYPRAQKYWPLFLWQLLENKNIEDLKVTGFDLAAEWMQILTSNPTSRKYEELLSRRLYRNGHYLLKDGDLRLDDSKPAGEDWPTRHLYTFKVALKSMSKIKANPKYGGFVENNHLSEKQIQSLFSAALKSTMDSMQHQLQSMSPGSTAHTDYVKCCQDAVSSLRSYTSNIHPVTDFFLRASLCYWPKTHDPRLYAAGLMSYAFRLEDFSEKPSFELFHYLYSGWKNDQMLSRVNHHTKCVLQVLKKWAFTEYMLANFVPAIILAGFESAGGCLLAKNFLPILAQRTTHFLQRNGPEGASTFTHLINILKMIINGIRVRACTERQPWDFHDGIWRGHRGIVSITCHFWISIQPALNQYVELHPTETSVLDEITSSLDDYMSDVRDWLAVKKDFSACTREQFKVTTGEYVARFVAALQDDFEHNWAVVSEEEIVLNGNGGPIVGVYTISLIEGVPTLEDLVELWKTSSGEISRKSLESWPRNVQAFLPSNRSLERNLHRMHATAFHVFRTAQRPISRLACRTIAGTRHPLPRRSFHRSAISYRIPEEPSPVESDRYEEISENRENGLNGTEAKDEAEHPPVEAQREDATAAGLRESLDLDDANIGIEHAVSLQSQEQVQGEGKNDEELTEDPNHQVDVENLALSQRRQTRYGSGRLRPNRPRTPEGLPPIVIPEWFFKKNVLCAGDDVSEGTLAVYSGGSGSEGTVEFPTHLEDISDPDLPSTQTAKYTINVDVYREIMSATRSGLTLRPPRNILMTSIPRPLLHLQCPKEDGTLYLDSVVDTVAGKLDADVIRLDPDDLAQLVGTYVDENVAWSWSKIAVLGFQAQKVAGKLEDYEKDLRAAEDAADLDGAEDDTPISRMFPFLSRPNRPRKKSPVVSTFNFPLASLLNTARSRATSSPSSENMPNFEVFAAQSDSNSQQQIKSASEQWLDLKLSAVLDALIGAADAKRAMSSVGTSEAVAQNAVRTSRAVIVQVKDYKLLNALPDGRPVLKKLRDAINKRWFDGRPMLMLGTTATDEVESALSKPEIQILQSDVIEGETRTIFVPPDRRQEQDDVFESDEKARIRRINIRHTEDMIVKLAGGNFDPSLTIDIENGLDTATAFSSDLEDQIWAYPRVHRLAITIIGQSGLKSSVSIDGIAFTKAYRLLEASDKAKFAWGAAELKEEDDEVEAALQDSTEPAKVVKDKIKKIRIEGTAHEKKLLGGVISPVDIHTTFTDVRAPKETVEALKTLTSLSLIRPEAFSYGVLATDKIPGLLLYGPPGTGKTLLAKAVAKESGATVLEVSGAEVSDMYVGEGEKNVKAIFSLAKKLSPCVVFIDEADSLLGSRSSESSKRTTHREIINQFLREWDGLKDLSAFIMVATNRPFDLDDAVLRRLPRRLLVDLPVEKDREAILKIHLKDEILDESVSLATLAKETPFYSGSDLKNVAVSAAMACIREENEVASKHIGEEPYVYPPKRILLKHHFTKALDEISASISEDMSTLSAIRKFDEKYGDRRGRRKKASSLGFGGTTVPERDSEAARVRKMEA